MQIGKESIPRTIISTANSETIIVRVRNLSKELIGKVSFTDYFYLLITGELPSPGATAVLDATLVAIAEHGLTPSVQASRMTLAAAPEAYQGAVAAGILGCGSVILEASETCGQMLAEVRLRASTSGDIAASAAEVLKEYRADNESFLVTGTLCIRFGTHACLRFSR